MKRTVVVLALLTVWAATTVSAPKPHQAHAADRAPLAVTPHSIEEAIGKALLWLQAHPADARGHEVIEVAEEVMFYYALRALALAPAELKSYRNEIASRHAALTAFNEELLETGLHLQGIWGPLTYPPLTHIISRMGMATASYRAIVDDLVAAHPYLYPGRDAMQLWITVYMERLGYTPATPVPVLLERSALRQDPQTGALLSRLALGTDSVPDHQATIQLIYDITHEVFALTDFGALPAPAAMAAQRDYYARLFDQGIRWAMRASAIDILAELLVSAHLLELHDLDSVPEAVALILHSQQADGSFGITNPHRRDGRRHGVLTCLLALKTVETR